MELFWHRRDLRIADNVGLSAAADRGPVVPLFVLDDALLEHAGPPRVRYLLDALAKLRDAYRERDGELVVAHGDPTRVVPAIAEGMDAKQVVWNRGYSGLATRRDERVTASLSRIENETHHDAVLHPPGAIRTNKGDPYSVFTYYGKKWRDREKADPVSEPADAALVDADTVRARLDGANATVGIETADGGGDEEESAGGDGDRDGDEGGPAGTGRLPSMDDLGVTEPEASIPTAGTEAARDRLASFCASDVFRYETLREYPAAAATSRLGADLSFGTIGIREVYAATVDAMARAAEIDPETDLASGRDGAPAGGGGEEVDPESSVEEFRSQLAWREFYLQVLYHNPSVVTTNYRAYENPIEWRDDPDELDAWKAGNTGYPIVDAGMRQLREEAYMHNRVRMIVASFLTKDLLIDWREGYDHFREYLVDHDTAADNGGWQWAASTGTDAQPYFRIFNPMTQGERYDPDAEYVTTYVPELRGVAPDRIHEWHELSTDRRRELAPTYPEPIVDHTERREAALAMFKTARGEE